MTLRQGLGLFAGAAARILASGNYCARLSMVWIGPQREKGETVELLDSMTG